MELNLGVRHWDHVAPIAFGDVTPGPDLTVALDRLDATPDLWGSQSYDGGETSLSRYVRARAAGDDRVVGLPVFLMRGFRHRCIVVRRNSAAERPEHLKGARIGLTGWPDSGNTWTRAILRESGVGIDDADWQVGPLTAEHPVVDRIGGVEVGPNVRHTADGARLVDLLETGGLDAVMTPFMPPGFHAATSQLRPLFRDTRAAERGYYERHGFVPGIHLLCVRREVLDRRPDVGQQLVDLFEAAKRLSSTRRNKLTDITPWHNEEVAVTAQVFGDDWMPYGLQQNLAMAAAFVDELVAQRLLDRHVPLDDLFPALEPTGSPAALEPSA